MSTTQKSAETSLNLKKEATRFLQKNSATRANLHLSTFQEIHIK